MSIDTVVNWQKVPESDLESQCSMTKINRIFQIPYLFENMYQSRSTFFVKGVFWLSTSIFETPNFLKWHSIFEDSPLCEFTKYNNFLRGYWFLAKNFVSLENSTNHIYFLQSLKNQEITVCHLFNLTRKVDGHWLPHWSATVMTPLKNIVSWMLSKDL